MNNIMIDIETLDTELTAIVVSIALVRFDYGGKINTPIVIYPSIEEQAKAGRTTSTETAIWWLTQNCKAIKSTFVDESQRLSVEDAKEIVVQAISTTPRDIWAKSPQFDISILENLFREKIAPFRRVFDVRTAQLFLSERPDYALPTHVAEEDCINQIRILDNLYTRFNSIPPLSETPEIQDEDVFL